MPQRPRTVDPLDVAFGKALETLRLKKHLSREQLGNSAGIDPSYVRALELGQRSPSLKTLAKVSGALDVKPSDLIRRAERVLGA